MFPPVRVESGVSGDQGASPPLLVPAFPLDERVRRKDVSTDPKSGLSSAVVLRLDDSIPDPFPREEEGGAGFDSNRLMSYLEEAGESRYVMGDATY